MKNTSLLIVDDEKNIRRSVEMICTGEGYAVKTAADAAEADQILAAETMDLILLDVMMPGMDGLTFLKKIKSSSPEVAVIMISGNATVQNAVAATKEGAYDFIEKPISKEKLLLSIQNALQSRTLAMENLELRKQVAATYDMVGESRAMQEIREQIAKVAPTPGRVLISGESGTGKELIARALHENSPRKNRPFIQVNCAAIPEELIESELFGNVKGAFTGAIENRDGKFSMADCGTLFLDEIGDMSLKVQAKVLRVLQEGEFQKVGGSKLIKVDVRVIAATNKDLEQEVKEGRFRDDLFFRLNVIPLVAPPLRRRKEDIPLLVQYFIDMFSKKNGYPKKHISDEAMRVLQSYDWPGNIRELGNIVERLMIMCMSEVVQPGDLPQRILAPTSQIPFNLESGVTLKELRENVEREYITATLKRNNWNISQAAKELDVDRTNLHKKINYYGLKER